MDTIFREIEEKPKNYEPSLFHACIQGKLTSVQWIFQSGPCALNTGRGRNDPLHYACMGGHLPIVEYFLSKGADIDETGDDGKTPLHYACERGYIHVVEYLISKGANVEAKARFDDEKTPLHYACEKGYLQIIECLLTKSSPYTKEVANINSTDNRGRTPLQYAHTNDKVVAVKYLISMGAIQ